MSGQFPGSSSFSAIWQILIIDDDEEDYMIVRSILNDGKKGKCEVHWASTYETGLRKLAQEHYDAVLVDYELGERTGIELIRAAYAQGYPAALIMYTGQGNNDVELEAMQAGATICLDKNEISPLNFERFIRFAIDRKQTENAQKESEEKFAKVFHGSPAGQLITRLEDGIIIDVNASYEKLLGYHREELIGRKTTELNIYQDPQERNRILEIFRKEGRVSNLEMVLRGKSGCLIYIIGSLEPLSIGGKAYLLSTLIDITDRKQIEVTLQESEAKLRESEQRFRRAIMSAPFPLMIRRSDGQVVMVNEAWTEITGYTLEDIPTTAEWTKKAYGERAVQTQALINNAGYSQSVRKGWGVFEVTTRYGTQRLWDFSTAPLGFDLEGKELVLSMAVDITEREHTSAALQISEEKFSRSFRSSPVAISISSISDGRLIEVNDSYVALFGYQREELIGHSTIELGIFQDSQTRETLVRKFLASKGFKNLELRLRTKSGDYRDVLFSTEPIELDGVDCALSLVVDITERKQAEAALQESEQKYRTLFENSPDAIFITNTDGQVEDANPTASSMFGWTEAEIRRLGRAGLLDQNDPRLNVALEERKQKGSFKEKEYTGIRKNGEWFPVEASSFIFSTKPARSFVILRDISERKKAEESLRASEQTLKLFVEYAPAAIAMFDLEMQYIAASHRYLEDYRLGNISVVGRSHYEIFPEIPERWKEIHRRCLAGAVEKAEEDPFPRLDGSLDWIRWEIHPWYNQSNQIGGLLLFSEVITERKQAADQIRQLSRLYALLSKVNQMTVRSKTPEALFNAFCQIATDEGEFILTWVGLYNRQSGLVTPVATTGVLPFQQIDIHSPVFQNGMVAEALNTGQLVYTNVNTSDSRPILWKETANGVKVQSVAVVPLQIQGQTAGVICFLSGNVDLFHSDPERLLIEEIAQDISYAWDALETSKTKRQWADAFENCAFGISISNPLTNTILTCNPAYAKALGRTIEEVASSPILDLFPPEEHEHVRQANLFADQVGKNQYQARMVRKDRTPFPVQMDLVSVRGDDGQLLYRVATLQDITERMQAEAEINRLLERLNLATRAGRMGIWDWDITRDDIIWDTQVYALYGLLGGEYPSLDDIWGKQVHPDDQVKSDEIALQAQRGERDYDTELRIFWPDGSMHWIRSVGQVLRDSDGRPIRMIGVEYDITEIKQAQQQLIESNIVLEKRVAERTAALSIANAELMRANHAKDDFLSTMSHELRTPLNGVLTLSESLQEGVYGVLTDRQKATVNTIRESGEHLLNLINDILDITKADAGYLELTTDWVNLEELIDASVRLIKPQMIKKNLKFDRAIQTNQDLIYADGRRIKQMLVNLLSNAVKFTPAEGRIGITVTQENEGEAVRFTVWDTGIGIPKEKISQLFQPFFQIDSSLSRQYNGTGLGLALVNRLAQLHGGSVGVESETSNGSQFWFTIPVTDPSDRNTSQSNPVHDGEHHHPDRVIQPDTTSTAEPQVKGLSPLIVLADDNAINLDSYMDVLRAKGYRVIPAMNGMEALERVKEFKPDLVLMDIQMPVMNGLETIRRLRADPAYEEIPIIALTALAMPGDRDLCLAAGADEYLAKPVSIKSLISSIEKFLHSGK